jgi:hypothetical protein
MERYKITPQYVTQRVSSPATATNIPALYPFGSPFPRRLCSRFGAIPVREPVLLNDTAPRLNSWPRY